MNFSFHCGLTTRQSFSYLDRSESMKKLKYYGNFDSGKKMIVFFNCLTMPHRNSLISKILLHLIIHLTSLTLKKWMKLQSTFQKILRFGIIWMSIYHSK